MKPEPTTPVARRSFLETVFVSRDERRARAGWRVLIQGVLVFFLVSCCTLPLAFLPGLLAPSAAFMSTMVAAAAAGAVAITAATYLMRRFVDRRTFRSLGFGFDRHTLPDLAAGFLIAGAQLGLVLVVMLAVGWTRWQGWAWETLPASAVASGLGLSLLLFILVGYQEELLSRGYQLQNLIEGSGLAWGLFLSSTIFALLHLGNPGTGLASTVGLVAAGYFLGFAWLRTRRLWLSIGLHVGWNLFEGTVFGFPVSGLQPFNLMTHTVTGPAWATGGDFGPEAGLVIVLAYALGVLLVLAYTRGRAPDTTKTPS